VHILTTSREGLDIAGETTFRVPPLSMPALGLVASPDQLLDYEAVQLFVERARAHRPSFTLTQRNAQAVHSICTRLDGLPLAIELAAARMRALSVENIDARLDQCFQLLTGGPRTALPRHQTLRAALDWSYDLLSTLERALLRRLSIFAGGWTLEVAELVCAGEPIGNWEVLDALSMLVDKSMVELDEREEGARYWLQETVRQYAHEKLMAESEAPRMYESHLAWCLKLAEDGETGLFGPEQFSWLNRLTAEHDNLRAALSWSTAVETQRGSGPATGLRLAGALWRFWWMRGFPHEGRRWLEMTLAAAGSAPAHLRARALAGAGVLAADQGDYTRARSLHEESLALWRTLGDMDNVAGALNNLGSAAQQQGDYRAARLLHEESLAFWRAQDNRPGIAGALNQLACIARDDQSDYARASSLLEESLALRRSLGDARGIA
ncbi:MAG: ATP-binding protein, partial [Chloroflexota bacterium]